MRESTERPKSYRFPKTIISYAVYLYHRQGLSYRDVQEPMFKRGVDVSHETVRAWCAKFGPELAEALRHPKPRRGRGSGFIYPRVEVPVFLPPHHRPEAYSLLAHERSSFILEDVGEHQGVLSG